MGLPAASLLVLFLGCCYSNSVHELQPHNLLQLGDFYGNWTINYTINSTDPNEVLANANAVLQAVKDLKAMVDSLTSNLTIANNTDYQRLEQLKADIDLDAANLTAIRNEYNVAVAAASNTQSLLDQINATLVCFSTSSCVTGGPTTSPGTGTTPINACASSPCKNNGTCVQSGNSYTCTCPLPYAGQNCESVTCEQPNQIFTASNSWQNFSANNYPSPINGLNCSWSIRAANGQVVAINISDVTLTGSGSFQVFDTLNNTILYSTSTTTSVATSVTSERNLVSILFDTVLGASGNFFLRYMSVAFDPCVGFSGCGANGTCVADGFSPQCHCDSCWTGALCNVEVPNPCTGFGSLCENGATCLFNNATCSGPYCACASGYTGSFCSTPVG